MKLLYIIGDAAVGKMTVGQELAKITDLRLFHNHMSIEPVIEIFGYFHKNAIKRFRDVIFEEYAASENYGMIFTLMWAFDSQSQWDYVNHISSIFEQHDAEIYYAELIAPLEIRLQRNETENRLRHKASKRDLDASRERVLTDSARTRFVSMPGEIKFLNYIRIENAELPPDAAARMIKERFEL
jgi:hypothetical protein